MVNKHIRDKLPYGTIVLDNPSFDNSIIGISFDGRLIYNYSLMVEEMMIEDECSYEDACDYIGYNTIRSLPYFGDKRPIIVDVIE